MSLPLKAIHNKSRGNFIVRMNIHTHTHSLLRSLYMTSEHPPHSPPHSFTHLLKTKQTNKQTNDGLSCVVDTRSLARFVSFVGKKTSTHLPHPPLPREVLDYSICDSSFVCLIVCSSACMYVCSKVSTTYGMGTRRPRAHLFFPPCFPVR